jgi:hypothetical protein
MKAKKRAMWARSGLIGASAGIAWWIFNWILNAVFPDTGTVRFLDRMHGPLVAAVLWFFDYLVGLGIIRRDDNFVATVLVVILLVIIGFVCGIAICLLLRRIKSVQEQVIKKRKSE